MRRRKWLLCIPVMFLAWTIGISTPSASARPDDLLDPGLVGCAQVFAAWGASQACKMGVWEGCLIYLLNLGLGLSRQQIEGCSAYILNWSGRFICESDGGTWFPGNPPLCIPCGEPGYECYTVVGDGGGGNGAHEPHIEYQAEANDYGPGGGGVSLWWIPSGNVSMTGCWSLYDENGQLIASGCD